MLEVKDYQTGAKKSSDNEDWQPSAQESETIKRLDDEMTIATRYRSPFEDQWQENIERYEAKPFYFEDGRAGVNLPIVKWIIESKQATEAKAPPTWSYKAKDYKEDKEIANILDDVIKQHVWNLKYVDLDTKMDILNQDKDILGGMYQYVGWLKIYRTIRKYKNKAKQEKEYNESPEKGMPTLHMEDSKTIEKDYKDGSKETNYDDRFDCTQELYYDDIVVENIHPQDVWLHPLALGVFDSPWIKIRKRMSYNKFLEKFSDTEMFKNVQFVKAGKWVLRGEGSADGKTILKDYATSEKDQVVIFEEWNIMRDELVIRANGVIVYEGPNPFEHKELPFVDYIDRLQFNTYVGEGEPQRIASICDAINAFINIAIDKEKKAGSGLNLLDDNGSDFDDVSTMFGTNQVARVQDPKNAFVHYEMPGMSATTDRIIGMLMDYLIFATGVDFRQITDMNASTQATVAAIRREISQGRLNLNVKRNENRGVKRLGWLLMKLVQQYYPLPLIDKLSGKEGSEGALAYRNIRVTGKNISEKPTSTDSNGKPVYTAKSLVMSEKGDGEIGFFQARPSYIRTKGDLEVQVVSESTFSASRELEKNNAKDYVGIATSTFSTEVDPVSGQPTQKPILSVRYGLTKLIEALGYDVGEAFDLEDKQMDDAARSEAAKFLPNQINQPTQEGMPGMNKALPPEKNPAKLVGASSEPVQQIKAELGAANTAV